MIEFLEDGKIWARIGQETKGKRQIVAVISYLSDARAIGFKEGDILIADLSDAALRSGVSSGVAAAELVAAGVELYSYPNLHAKVILVGGELLISGSTNLSLSSKARLLEAGMLTDEDAAIKAAFDWILRLKRDGLRVTARDSLRMKKIKPERHPYTGGAKQKKKDAKRERAAWYLSTSYLGRRPVYVEEDELIAEALSEEPRFDGWEIWPQELPTSLRGKMKMGDIVFWHDQETSRNGGMVWPAARIVKIKTRRDEETIFLAYRHKEAVSEIKYGTFKILAARSGWKMGSTYPGSRSINRKVAGAIEANWP